MGLDPTREIEKLIWEWLYTTLGYDEDKVIRSDQNGPPLEYDFATFQVLTDTSDENPVVDRDEQDADFMVETYKDKITVLVSVQVWANDALEKHRQLHLSRKTRVTREIFTPYRACFLGAEGSTNDPFLGDTEIKNKVTRTYRFTFNAQAQQATERVHGTIDVSGQLVKG